MRSNKRLNTFGGLLYFLVLKKIITNIVFNKYLLETIKNKQKRYFQENKTNENLIEIITVRLGFFLYYVIIK